MSDAQTLGLTAKPRRRGARLGLLGIIAVLIGLICALPHLAVLIAALQGGSDTLAHLMDTVLLGYTVTLSGW